MLKISRLSVDCRLISITDSPQTVGGIKVTMVDESNGSNFMDFILSICDDTIMHMKFCHGFLGNI